MKVFSLIRLSKKGVVIIALLCLSITASFAQSGTARGFVYDKETGEPIIYTTVFLKGTNLGTITDVNGYYSISTIPPGEYVLNSTNLGYDTASVRISITANQIITKKLFLTQKPIELEEVNISAAKQESKTEVQISVTKITPKDIRQIPTIGGEPDFAQYLQILPGVIFTGDQGGQLYIRGGAPIQNKIMLDGMIVYNPFHTIGLFSVFDTDIIRNIDVYTGGFNAEYGGRISAVMDLTTRDGNKKRFAGKASINPFVSKLLVEGPFKKNLEEGKGSSSFIFSGKTSYLEQSSKFFYNYIDTAGLPYNFTDLYGKASFSGENGSKFNIFGFNYRDNVNYTNTAKLNWNSLGAGSNFILIPTTTSVLIQGNFAYSGYNISLQESDLRPRFSKINGFNSALNFTYFIKQDEIKYGLEILGFETDFEFYNALGQMYKQNDFTTEIAGFFKYKKILKKLLLEPSFRIHYYSSLNNVSIEPRLGSKYNFTDKLRLKFAGGWYSQNFISASSDKDIVNIFNGFLSGPDNIPETFDGKEIKHNLQKNRQIIFGIEYDLVKYFEINAETYLKQFTQLTNVNRNKIYDDNEYNKDQPDNLKKVFIIETGKSYGADFLLKYTYKRWYLWLGYSYAYTDRYDGFVTYNPHFDRRHNLNFVGAYTFGKDLNWEFNCRWNYGSGFPFTQIQGYYPFIDFADGINTDYTTINEQLGVQYSSLNKGRLPDFHRLDVSLQRNIELSKNSTLHGIISISNVYNRQNIFYYDGIRNKRINQLPILPSAGLSLTF